jgi:hypothetical protein
MTSLAAKSSELKVRVSPSPCSNRLMMPISAALPGAAVPGARGAFFEHVAVLAVDDLGGLFTQIAQMDAGDPADERTHAEIFVIRGIEGEGLVRFAGGRMMTKLKPCLGPSL